MLLKAFQAITKRLPLLTWPKKSDRSQKDNFTSDSSSEVVIQCSERYVWNLSGALLTVDPCFRRYRI